MKTKNLLALMISLAYFMIQNAAFAIIFFFKYNITWYSWKRFQLEKGIIVYKCNNYDKQIWRQKYFRTTQHNILLHVQCVKKSFSRWLFNIISHWTVHEQLKQKHTVEKELILRFQKVKRFHITVMRKWLHS